LGRPDNLEDLNKFFDLFDDAYFGDLKGYYRLEWIEERETMRHFWEDFWGLCRPYRPGEQRDPRFAMAKPFVVISLQGQDCTHLEAIRIYLTVLLHERVHAIFDIHTCIYENGCKQKYARVSGRGH
jgi:hypothetical protein